MRVIVYVETDIVAGAETVTGHLVDSLRPDIDVVAMGPSVHVVEHLAARRPGCEAIVVPPMRARSELKAFPTHRRLLSSFSPAIFQVAVTHPTACSWPLVAARTVRGITSIAVEHLSPIPLSRRELAAKRRGLRGLGAHVAVSEYLARAIEREYDLRPDSIVTIPNGVPDVELSPERFDAAGLVVGAAGRFDPIKGLDLLVRAVADLPELTLYLVGDGEHASALRTLARDEGVADRTKFVGWSERARSYLAAFDIVAVPSRAETFGMVAVEAMLAERPVIAAVVGGLPEVVVDDVTGMLIPPDDVETLVSALRRLAADDALRARLGAAGRRRALDHFSPPTMARAYEHLYDDLVDRDVE